MNDRKTLSGLTSKSPKGIEKAKKKKDFEMSKKISKFNKNDIPTDPRSSINPKHQECEEKCTGMSIKSLIISNKQKILWAAKKKDTAYT